ncbi:MAG: dienelactone hydrolase family protein [Alphaproteobacteria bacterium]
MTSIPERIVVAGQVAQPQRVQFSSQSPSLLADVAPLDGAAAAEAAIPTQGALFLPDGPRRNLPGVVIVQGLGGLKPERELTYGLKLAEAGFAALAVDSFGARGMADAPDFWKALRISTWSLLADAFAALRFLAEHPAVNPDAIAVIGFSWGGMSSVLAGYEQVRAAFIGKSSLGFAGHASYYGCSIPRLADPVTTGAPMLVMVGARDENVSLERTRLICDDLRRGGSAVDLKVFDAFHQWDGKDDEVRHVGFSLADLGVIVTPDNQMHLEPTNEAITSHLSEVWQMIRNLRLRGYDILRDPALHRETDALLLEFLVRMAARGGCAPPVTGRVPLGAIGAAE